MAQRILVVDDDREIVRLLRASLEQAGYQVLVAYNGETALHVLRRDAGGHAAHNAHCPRPAPR